ncbi:MAG: diguanylate cyclase/phosphodiesterase with and sensor(s) [Actinomycetia bacterium]|nr:diguanylate cyclase/phosphodiesterase with and sensor(s) [Actinomycetes bacterium]
MSTDAPPATNSEFGLDAGQLHNLFPFHLVFDRDMRAVQVGRSIARACAGLAGGSLLADHLHLASPPIPLGFDQLKGHEGSLILLRSIDGKVTLRGQVISAGPDLLSFFGSPWVTDPSALETMGLTLSDFALQDSVADYMFLLQAQATALDDAQRLAAKLQEVDEEKARLAAAEQALAHELNALPDLVIRLNRVGMLLDVRPAKDSDLSAPREELVGSSVFDAFPEMTENLREALERSFLSGKTQSFEYNVTRHDVENFYEARVVRCSDTEALALVRDVSERRSLERQLVHQAFHDSLTGLANRALFEDRVEHALALSVRHADAISVLFIDLDDFKRINDTLGHRVGDSLLVAVAARLHDCIRPGDTVARLGGDEFAVLIEDGGLEVAECVARRLINAFGTPFDVNENQLVIGASIGVAASTAETVAADLLRNADMAMYSAKSAGKGRPAVFDPMMEDRLLSQLLVETELRDAVAGEQFRVLYQPVVDIRTGQISGAEALVRWQHPTRGLLGPFEFIPLAEQSGLIVPIGTWVLRESCRQAAIWQHEHPNGRPFTISVNLSTRQLAEPGLVDVVSSALAETGLDPSLLVLEITETALVQDAERAAAVLGELKELGLQIALDDFGTGYSSLSHLRRFPFDVIKVDKSFIDGITGDDGSSALARAILEIGRILGVHIVAEGVETEAQFELLRQWHCPSAQGYFFARPIDPESLGAMWRTAGTHDLYPSRPLQPVHAGSIPGAPS